jgi:hypothetical protein
MAVRQQKTVIFDLYSFMTVLYPSKYRSYLRKSSVKFSKNAVLILCRLLNDKGVAQEKVSIMFTSLLAEALAVAFDNLNMTATILECSQAAAEELSPEAQQRLSLVHIGLSMALQAMEHEELKSIMEQSDAFMPAW